MEPYLIMVIVWCSLFLLTLIVELATTELVSIWFTVGSIVALIFDVALPHEYYWVSIIVFVVVSTVSLIVFLTCFRKKLFTSRKYRSVIEEQIGKENVVTSETSKESGFATIKINGVVYNVQCDEHLNVDDVVVVKNVEGNHFIVKKIEK